MYARAVETGQYARGEIPEPWSKVISVQEADEYCHWCTLQPEWAGPSKHSASQRRALKNRECAAVFRKRRKEETDGLLKKISELKQENSRLTDLIEILSGIATSNALIDDTDVFEIVHGEGDHPMLLLPREEVIA